MTRVGTSVDVYIQNPQKSLMPVVGFRVSSHDNAKTITQLWLGGHQETPILGLPMNTADAAEFVRRGGGVIKCVDIK